MNQRQILINRVLNEIQITKRKLSPEQMPLFNDLLIISCIVPQVSKKVLRLMLEKLKPHKSNCRENHEVQITKLIEILAQVKHPSNLLQDFLECTGYSSNSVPFDY